jgi:hypothetical protein
MLHTTRAASRDNHRADEARRFVRGLEQSLARTPHHLPVEGLDRISATDRTATVTCVVDVRGTFVDLSIGTDWWHSVGPTAIASAVLEALQFAQDKAMVAMTLLRRRGIPIPASASPHSPSSPGEASPHRPRDAWAEWAAAEAKVEHGYTLMKIADRVVELRDSPRPRTISGPHGLFRLDLVGFTITHGEVNLHGLSPADTDRLADDARDALRQATREQDPTYWFAGEETRR